MNNPIRILLVDDSPYFHEAARIVLARHKAIELVDTAFDGEEALAKSQIIKPDLILLDLNLGDRSGLELIPLFRNHLPQTRIIVLTIMSDESYRAAAIQAGANAFVDKISMNWSLLTIIRQQMDCPAEEQKTDQPPAAKPEPPKIEDDQEPKK